jgi:hypothetical protein
MESNSSALMRELLQRRSPRAADEVVESRPVTQGLDEEYVAFANGRLGNRAQLSVIFRFANGRALGLSYLHLFSVQSDDPSRGCTVQFSPATVIQIQGQNLERLFESLCCHRAAEIVEVPRHATLLAGSGPIVESIQVVRAKAIEPRQLDRQT